MQSDLLTDREKKRKRNKVKEKKKNETKKKEKKKKENHNNSNSDDENDDISPSKTLFSYSIHNLTFTCRLIPKVWDLIFRQLNLPQDSFAMSTRLFSALESSSSSLSLLSPFCSIQ